MIAGAQRSRAIRAADVSGRISSLRDRLRRIPRAALVCALVALLNSTAWALLLPPLQGHDEQAHVYYVQYLAETGNVPRPTGANGQSYTQEQNELVNGLHLFDVVGNADGRPPWTDAERDAVDRTLSGKLSRVSKVGGNEGVGAYTPLYYGAAAVGYKVASGGTLIDRIVAMRIVSALLAAMTVLFVFMFLRELLPRHPWAWPVGALAVAFQPVFAYISGTVNPDAGLACASAAVFYLLARAFRRGLTPRLAATLGIVVALGILAKVTMVAFVPGVALGVVLLVLRAYRAGDRRPLRLLLPAAAAFALPIVAYCVVNTSIWDRPLLPGGGSGGGGGGVGGVVSAASGVGGPQSSLGGLLSYAWQDYLPRLGFMTPWFDGYNGWDVWFKTFWGAFGWGDYGFSHQAFVWVLVGSILIAIGALWALVVRRRAWWSWLAAAATYAVMILGLLGLIAYVGYGLRTTGVSGFEQGRYLLPLLAPFAAIIALGVIGAGRRFGRFAGVLVVVGSIGLTVYAHLLTVAHFYA